MGTSVRLHHQADFDRAFWFQHTVAVEKDSEIVRMGTISSHNANQVVIAGSVYSKRTWNFIILDGGETGRCQDQSE